MIIWLASYPRSGNTFFRILVKRMYGLSTFSVYEDQPLAERAEVAELVGHEQRPMPLEAMAASERTFLVKTHDLPGDDAAPAVYLVRDGRDAVVSYARYVLSFEPEHARGKDGMRHILSDLIRGEGSFGGWSGNVRAWLKRTDPRAVVRFEDLIADPVGVTRRAMSAVGFPAPAADVNIPSFEELQTILPGFFRRGQVGTWRQEIPADLQTVFWLRHGAIMEELGYAEQ